MSFASSGFALNQGSNIPIPKPLSLENFNYIRDVLRRVSAMSLEDGKEYLVETRLGSIAAKNGCVDVNQLIDKLKQLPVSGSPLLSEIVDAMTINETSFFRDLHPFEALKNEVIPHFLKVRAPSRRLNIWSAACSTGQEPYSIAMMLTDEFPQLETWDVKLLATDLASSVIAKAKSGKFPQFDVNRGLAAKSLIRHFKQEWGDWRLNDSIRNKVEFRQMNLIGHWPIMPQFDVVLLRNVLIYFDTDVRRQILRRIRSILAPDGYLILGNAETAVTLDSSFVTAPVGRATFFRLAG